MALDPKYEADVRGQLWPNEDAQQAIAALGAELDRLREAHRPKPQAKKPAGTPKKKKAARK